MSHPRQNIGTHVEQLNALVGHLYWVWSCREGTDPAISGECGTIEDSTGNCSAGWGAGEVAAVTHVGMIRAWIKLCRMKAKRIAESCGRERQGSDDNWDVLPERWVKWQSDEIVKVKHGQAVWRNGVQIIFSGLISQSISLLPFTLLFLSFPGFMLLEGRNRKEWEVDGLQWGFEKHWKNIMYLPSLHWGA